MINRGTAIIPGNTVTVTCVRQRILGRDGKTPSREGRGLKKLEFARFCLQPLLHKPLTTKQPKKDATQANNTVNKLRQVKLRENTICLLTQCSEAFINPGRCVFQKLFKKTTSASPPHPYPSSASGMSRLDTTIP